MIPVSVKLTGLAVAGSIALQAPLTFEDTRNPPPDVKVTSTRERGSAVLRDISYAMLDAGVRNNAMRVFLYLVRFQPELDYPVADLIAALDFPSGSDRNKAGYTLAGLAAQPRYRDAIRAGAAPIALRMLRLEQPNNHDPAYEILKLVSGESFGDRDYAAWERWAAANLARR